MPSKTSTQEQDVLTNQHLSRLLSRTSCFRLSRNRGKRGPTEGQATTEVPKEVTAMHNAREKKDEGLQVAQASGSTVVLLSPMSIPPADR